MSRRRQHRALILIVLATVALRVGYAAPALAAAQVRAITWCAAHEKAAPPVREAERCCHVVSDAGDPTVPGTAPVPPIPMLVALPVLPDPGLAAVPPVATALRVGHRATGPPRYLRLLTLLR